MRLCTFTSLGLYPLLLCCCGREPPAPSITVEDEAPVALGEAIGVFPEQFQCRSVAPDDAIANALGPIIDKPDPAMDNPEGTPRECNYVVASDAGGAEWKFDMDCRGTALEDGEQLMVQYTKSGPSIPVLVGRSGMDHHGAALLFIDDDAPCYVRVLGPTPEGRLTLARIISERLTERTAPMRTIYRQLK